MSEEDLRKAQIEQEAVEFSEKLAVENPGVTQDGDNLIKVMSS